MRSSWNKACGTFCRASGQTVKKFLYLRLDRGRLGGQSQPQNCLWVGGGEQLPGGGRSRRLLTAELFIELFGGVVQVVPLFDKAGADK